MPMGWTWKPYKQGSAELGISERPQKYFATDREPQKNTLRKTKR